MRRFFRKGTANQCLKLLPEEFWSDELIKRINSLRTPVQATPEPHRSRDTLSSAEQYFERLIPDQKNRLTRVVKVAQHIAQFRYQEIVDRNRVDYNDSIRETPLARVQAIYEKLSSKQDSKSYRYNLLYFSNAVDQYESLQLQVAQGRRNKSVAFDEISNRNPKTRETVRRMYSDAGRYLECSEIGGPGSLLTMNAPKSE